jgi:hypothetical protein
LAAKATNTALALKAPIASPSFTGTTAANKLNVTGVVDNTISGTLVVKGSLSANQTSGLALFQQSSTASTIKAFGPNATTTGILNTYVAASDGSPDLLITSVTANGLTFNGDTAAANALSDYETGTWTPVLLSTTGGSAVSNTNVTRAYYTKVGNMVNLYGTYNWASGGSNANTYTRISGFPFATSNSTNQRSSGVFGAVIGFNDSEKLGIAIDAGSSFGWIVKKLGANFSHNNTIAASGFIYGIMITYFTDV